MWRVVRLGIVKMLKAGTLLIQFQRFGVRRSVCVSTRTPSSLREVQCLDINSNSDGSLLILHSAKRKIRAFIVFSQHNASSVFP